MCAARRAALMFSNNILYQLALSSPLPPSVRFKLDDLTPLTLRTVTPCSVPPPGQLGEEEEGGTRQKQCTWLQTSMKHRRTTAFGQLAFSPIFSFVQGQMRESWLVPFLRIAVRSAFGCDDWETKRGVEQEHKRRSMLDRYGQTKDRPAIFRSRLNQS